MLIWRTRFWLSSILLLSLSGAHAESPSISQDKNTPQVTSFSPHTQTLAASCAACHGTNGNSVSGTPVLAGLDSSHFIMQMLAFRSGERQATVMHRHAKGLTAEEIEQLAAYFSQQKREQAVVPPSQVLEEAHEH
ncbi:MAG TPA: c-type cytochrome [Methylophilaceae bacterium]|nr:c-type cytochrome [Methylophilaceae bacterium]